MSSLGPPLREQRLVTLGQDAALPLAAHNATQMGARNAEQLRGLREGQFDFFINGGHRYGYAACSHEEDNYPYR